MHRIVPEALATLVQRPEVPRPHGFFPELWRARDACEEQLWMLPARGVKEQFTHFALSKYMR